MAKIDYCNCVCICFGIFSFLGIIFAYIWPISEIIIGIFYIKEIQCDFFINIALCLIIKALLSVFLVTCICIYFYYDEKLFFRFYSYLLIILFTFINLGWTIVETLLFLNYCNNIPEEINTYLWFSLFFGYLGFFNIIYFLHVKV